MEETKSTVCPCKRTAARSEETKRKLQNRLSRIEGQIRGVRRMLDEDAYCPDILTQSAAVTAAMNAFNRELIASHIRSCVVTDVMSGKLETVDELTNVLEKLMK